MQLHELQAKTPRQRSRQIGRGGKRGKTAGRGTKGQKARAGHRIRPALRDEIKKLPKRRGYRFAGRAETVAVINLGQLEKAFTAGTAVTPMLLLERGLLRRVRGKVPAVKILASGALTKPLVLSGMTISATARAVVERIGGQVS